MSRRVRLGKQNDASIGLRSVLAGYDAFSGDGNGGEFTFNSAWTDIVDIHQVGVLSYQASGLKKYDASGAITTINDFGFGTLFTSLGYRPFIEMRRFTTANLINDDYWSSDQEAGSACLIFRDCFIANSSATPTPTTDKVFYVIFKLQPPQQGSSF